MIFSRLCGREMVAASRYVGDHDGNFRTRVLSPEQVSAPTYLWDRRESIAPVLWVPRSPSALLRPPVGTRG
jgi:hypothetical protein